MADETSSDDDSLLIQASQMYEASLNGDTSLPSQVVSYVESPEESCSGSDESDGIMANENSSDDNLLIQASQMYEGSFSGETSLPSQVACYVDEEESYSGSNDSDDRLFLAASQKYEEATKASNEYVEQILSSASEPPPTRFSVPITEEELEKKIKGAIDLLGVNWVTVILPRT